MIHTPEPWKINPNLPFEVQDSQGNILHGNNGYDEIQFEKAALQRIVTCVNFCAGIHNDHMERTTLKEIATSWAGFRSKHGLNPAAYRACIECLHSLIEIVENIRVEGDETGYLKQTIQDAKRSLALAEQQP